MNKIARLETKITEQDKFIKNILTELSDLYDLFDDLKKNTEALTINFLVLIKEIERR